MNSRFRVPASAALLALLLSGCGAGGQTPGTGSTPSGQTSGAAAPTSVVAKPGEPWFDELKAAESSGKVSVGCQLPVEFEVAKGWKVQTVQADNELGKVGPFQAACEVDAKPAGNIGFLRVYTSTVTAEPKEALEKFLVGLTNVRDPEFRTVASAKLPAVETTYLRESKLGGEKRRQRAVAVKTARGALVLELGGLDSQENKEMLPALLLATATLTPRG